MRVKWGDRTMVTVAQAKSYRHDGYLIIREPIFSGDRFNALKDYALGKFER